MSADHDANTLSALAPFRGAGFALHWLYPKSKRPSAGDRWSELPVASLDELRLTHRAGSNLGVRLGEPSRLSDSTFLHVLDVDIRIPDLADEAWARLAELFPGIDLTTFPTVQSGSDGESRHIYIATSAPLYGRKLAVSEGKHRRIVTGKETWSYDWEIELFGTGKQVAMPPSIHPDTGKPYVWLVPFDLDGLACGINPAYLPLSALEAIGAVETATYAFETRPPLTFEPGQLERDLDAIPVSRIDDREDWITLGQALHHQFGGSDEGFELWMRHSARGSKFLVGSTRAKELRRYRGFGRNRRQPVTMATIRLWATEARQAALIDQFDEEPLDDADDDADDDSDDFEDLLGGSPTASTGEDEFDAILNAPVAPTNDWVQLLHLNDEGELKATLHNIRLIVENDTWTRGLAAFNEFTQEIVQRGRPARKNPKRRNPAKPTLQLDGPSFTLVDPINGDFWTENKDNAIRALIEAPPTQGGYGIKIPDRDLRAAIDIAGRKNSFHPVREYLHTLTWDGVPRAETLFIDYVGAPDNSYSRAVARNMLIAAVTRVHEPGHKFDFAVILEGFQGKRKSTFIRILAKDWFAELDGDFSDAKQMVELMQGAWLLEIPELSGFVRAEVQHVKAFISRQSDKVRLAYAKRAQEYLRQCVFMGSTNDDRYLKDATGGRRFWPVACRVEGEIDTDRLEANVDQIWAEALTLYREARARQPVGALPLYLVDEDAKTIAKNLQEAARVESADDAAAGKIAAWLDRPVHSGDMDDASEGQIRDETCLLEIWIECFNKDAASYTGAQAQMLGRAMSRVPGWEFRGSWRNFRNYGRQRTYLRIG